MSGIERHRLVASMLLRAMREQAPEALRGQVIALLQEHVDLTLRHGALGRLSQAPKSVPAAAADANSTRNRGVDVAAAWRRIDAVAAEGYDVSSIRVPCRATAVAAALAAIDELNAMRVGRYRTDIFHTRPQPPAISVPDGARARHADQWRAVTSMTCGAMAAEAAEADTPATRRDEIWREAKRRGWSRRQLLEAFE